MARKPKADVFYIYYRKGAKGYYTELLGSGKTFKTVAALKQYFTRTMTHQIPKFIRRG